MINDLLQQLFPRLIFAPVHDEAYFLALRPELTRYVQTSSTSERLQVNPDLVRDAWTLIQEQPTHWGAHTFLSLCQLRHVDAESLLKGESTVPPVWRDWFQQRQTQAHLQLWPRLHKLTPTILLPTYNRCESLKRAVNSVLQQSHTDWQLLICNDASQDDTAAYCQALSERDTRIKVLHNAQNLGCGASINRLYHIASSELVCTLADDDLLLPDCLAECLALFQRYPWIALAAGGYYCLNERVDTRLRCYGPYYSQSCLAETRRELQRCAVFNPIFGGGAMIRKTALAKISAADPLLGDMTYSGWDTWITQACLGHYLVAYSAQKTAFHHVRKKSGQQGDRPIWGAANFAMFCQMKARFEALFGAGSYAPWLEQRFLGQTVLPQLDYAIASATRFFKADEALRFQRAQVQIRQAALALYEQAHRAPNTTDLRPETVYGLGEDYLTDWPQELQALFQFS